MKSPTQSKGEFYEQIAKDYLECNNLEFITSNYSCNHGEIDLIMQDRANIIFVEVRVRSNDYYGHPIETIDKRKQTKLINTAEHFLNNNYKYNKQPLRFDAVTMMPKKEIEVITNNTPDYKSYKNYKSHKRLLNIEWFKNIITTE
jgi:putative endonuclease